MLQGLLSSLLRRGHRRSRDAGLARLEEAEALMALGDFRTAADIYKAHLEKVPDDVGAINNLGACLGNIGDNDQAMALFDRAYALDDTYLPTLANYAGALIDRKRSAEAMPLLYQAWCCEPGLARIGLNYSSVCLNNGDSIKAAYFQLQHWLANYDCLRSANGLMFKSAYADIAEETLAAEHLLWGETLRPLSIKSDDSSALAFLSTRWRQDRRMRVGYWSPDLRNHSVRYFFRPLLEGHRRDRVETFLFHDFHAEDRQTELMKEAADHFYDVYEMNDADLYKFIIDQKLDVLVELAGHTSANRLPLLQNRLAKVQLTGIGYPPTTGLSTIDGKFMDPYVVGDEPEKFYTERPVILPRSFWCFDPKDSALIEPVPPARKAGYVTFACVGNLGKINARMLGAWRQLLERVPTARLMIRSVSFEDAEAIVAVKSALQDAALPMERVDVRMPEGGAAFFASYNEIDVVLDTFPFNGGTTTCFATYMGVPVVTLYGRSLLSRMGLSILSNLGMGDLAVDSEQAYVDTAVKLAGDLTYLEMFRRTARERFQRSSIGNGQLFARDVEQAYERLLELANRGELAYTHHIQALPESELIARAYKVWFGGQRDASLRIIDHCLRHYPNSGGARLFMAQQKAQHESLESAMGELQECLVQLPAGGDQTAAWILLCKWAIQLNRVDLIESSRRQLESLTLDDPLDRLQVALLLEPWEQAIDLSETTFVDKDGDIVQQSGEACFLIPCDDVDEFERKKVALLHTLSGQAAWHVEVRRCPQEFRDEAYRDFLNCADLPDIVVIMQRNAEILNPYFLQLVENALQTADVVACAGALTWDQFSWRDGQYARKFGGFFTGSSSASAAELHLFGEGFSSTSPLLQVLDGHLLAFKPHYMRQFVFDPEMNGPETLIEEDWVHQAALAGARLRAVRTLGVSIQGVITSEPMSLAPPRLHALKKYNFDPFSMLPMDRMSASVGVLDPLSAAKRLPHFLARGEERWRERPNRLPS